MRKLLVTSLFAAVVPLVTAVWVTTQPLAGAVRSGPEVTVDPRRLEATVRKLAVELHPRGWPDVEHLDQAAVWLREQLSASAPTAEQTWVVRGHTYRNVSAYYGPATGPRVVVGAHYDSADSQPGADDDASGVAGVLELGRLLGAHPPPFRVELVCWSLEEPPYFRQPEMGSTHHADALAAAGDTVKAAISLEMIGSFHDEPDSQHFPVGALGLIYPTTANYIAVVGDLGQVPLVRTVKAAMRGANELPVASINAPRLVPGIDWSDHLSYWRHGWPAVMVTDTAMNRNANYHGAGDVPPTLDYARMAKVVQGVHSAIWAMGLQ